jgi:hypothetical protein
MFFTFFFITGCSVSSVVLTQTPDTIVFNPSVITVNNSNTNTPNSSQQFTINMTIVNSLGEPLIPNIDNPIHVDVYGAPNGVISPTSTTTSTGAVTFTYSGASFPNNITVNAWITDNTNGGAALGVTQILKQNVPSSCVYGTTSYQVPLVGTLPDALQVMADVGYNTSASNTTLKAYTIDTGSLGVVVPTSELPKNSDVIGPGAAGVKYYDSSGNTYSGNYYLAPVRFKLNGSTVQTQPIMVLGISRAYCTGPTSRACYSGPAPTPNLHYLGVGFNRNSTTAGDLFSSPTANAFLHINNVNNGTDMSPGYYLAPNDANPSVTGITLGVTTNAGYNTINLTPNSTVPGDFNPQAGCYSFTSLAGSPQFCGTALLDVGIDYMFLDLPRSQWPAGSFDSNDNVPNAINMSILMGTPSAPSMPYSFVLPISSLSSNPGPTKVQWIDSASTGQIFFNTGRRPLYSYDYMYNGQCGQVGFHALP